MQTQLLNTISDLSNRKLWLLLDDDSSACCHKRIEQELIKRKAFQMTQQFHQPH